MRKLVNITPFVALEKMKNWCAYQERAQSDARQKLYLMGIKGEVAENIITTLIEENFLNEERFALAFARGKMRIKQWGKQKIRIELKKHGISETCMKKALKELEDDEYAKVLDQAIEKKIRLLKVGDKRTNFYKIVNHLLSKGFEKDLVVERLNVILKTEYEN